MEIHALTLTEKLALCGGSLLPGGREKERADRSRGEQERRSDRGRHDLVLESVESAVLCHDAGGCQNTFGCPVCGGGGGGGGKYMTN